LERNYFITVNSLKQDENNFGASELIVPSSTKRSLFRQAGLLKEMKIF
jgi:hypothetical protein